MNKNLTPQRHFQDLSPFSMFRDEMWDLFDRFSQDLSLPQTSLNEFTPKIEIKDQDKSYLVCAEIPGMSERDINVSLRDNALVIEGERKNEVKNEDKKKGFYHSEFSYGRFYRTIPLGQDADMEKISASYKNGLLSVEVPKRAELANKTRKIEINAGAEKTKH